MKKDEASKSKVGRPRAYASAPALQVEIDTYFNSISRSVAATEEYLGKDGKKKRRKIKNDNGEQLHCREWLVPPTFSGLLLHLGITRETWNQYSKQEEYAAVTALAKQIIESYLEQLLVTKSSTHGVEFNLSNNFGWKNRREVELGEDTRSTLESGSMSLSERINTIRNAATLYINNQLDGEKVGGSE